VGFSCGDWCFLGVWGGAVLGEGIGLPSGMARGREDTGRLGVVKGSVVFRGATGRRKGE
jgi:hypothetical protein